MKKKCPYKIYPNQYTTIQSQLAASLNMVIPKYSKKIKPTAGCGTGCGYPGCQLIPPLWMYSLNTQRPKPYVPPRPKTIKRKRYKHKKNINYNCK